jgi:nucleoid-associated protein YgaU
MENTPSVPELSGLAAVATAVPSVPSLSNTVRADETPYHPPSALPVNSAPSGPGNTLAAQYRVKPWNVSADCFWNIAGKPWVYGDPNKWSFLYYANRFKLPDPQDPHILPVGVLLDIPSLEGETREGIRGEKE